MSVVLDPPCPVCTGYGCSGHHAGGGGGAGIDAMPGISVERLEPGERLVLSERTVPAMSKVTRLFSCGAVRVTLGPDPIDWREFARWMERELLPVCTPGTIVEVSP